MLKKRRLRSLSTIVIVLFLISLVPCLPFTSTVLAVGNTYYVDSVGGNDAYNGLTPASAFKSLSKLNSMTFMPGDKILFKQGCTWDGYFKPNGSGNSINPIIVNAYDSNGNEATGAIALSSKPYIRCNGDNQTGDSRIQYQHAYAVHLKNVEYWELNNLRCSVDNDNIFQGTFGDLNHSGDKWSSSTNKGRNWVGIMVEARDYNNNGDKIINHVYVKNCYVNDVDGNYALWHKDGFSGGITYLVWTDAMNDGIFSTTEQTTTPVNKFDDILVENCYIKDSSRAGITVGTSIWSNKFDGYGGIYPDSVMSTYGHTNINIRNNVVENLTGDGIEVLYAKGPVLVEKNMAIKYGQDTLNNNSDEFTSAGIWSWRSPNAIFQYNEASWGNNWGDGQAFDVDWTLSVIYQYNYSHDNRGGAVLLCGDESKNSTYRYNISQNDKYFWDDMTNGGGNKLYNNTFIAGSYTTGVMRRTGGAETVENNIFYVPLGKTITANWDSRDSFDYNCYYNITKPAGDVHAVQASPSFVATAPVMSTIDTTKVAYGTYSQGSHNTAGYLANLLAGLKLDSTSPCINAGKIISNNGGYDFGGNPLYNGSPDIGAFEYQGTVSPPTIPPVPTGLSATAISSSQISVTWNASSGATGYDLLVDGTTVSNVSSPYVHTGLAANSNHTYKVLAKNSVGSSAWSTQVGATTPASSPTNVALNKTATANSYITGEEPLKAVDGTTSSNSKWCSNSNIGSQWLRVDLGSSYNINRWVVKHAGAGGESSGYNTRDFKLQKSTDGIVWTDVDSVTGNTANITDRTVTSFNSRYVRLYITNPQTSTSYIASRIYEFEVYGN